MYPHKLMPDPAGAERIMAKGGKVFFAKDELITAAKLVTPDDVADEPDERRPDMPAAKKIKRPIWLVTLELPRNFLDSMTSDKVKIDDLSIDTQTVEDAYDDGLGDDDALRSD